MARNTTEVPIHDVLAQRWSPRGFDAAHELDETELRSLFEAARWAPSARNLQPWKFVAARRGSAEFGLIHDALMGFNQDWAGAASLLVVAFAETERDGKAQRWAEYDLGQAMAHLTVQAETLGLNVHQMGGFSPAALSAAFAPGVGFTPVVVAAIGRHTGCVAESIRDKDAAPRDRKPYADLFV
ncbi:MAG: nitroreductase family protein [Propionibacteriaceae bacterium]|nr:nitroreductase family protein [Propionibacteriaceae bacterium]